MNGVGTLDVRKGTLKIDKRVQNTVASVIVCFLFVLVSAIIGLLLDMLLRTVALFGTLFLVLSGLQTLFGLSVVSKAIAEIMRARPVDESNERERRIKALFEEVKNDVNVEEDLTLMVMPSLAANALCVGIRRHEHLVIISEGMLDKLTDVEIKAVLFHELYHLVHGITDYLTAVSGTFGAPFLVHMLTLSRIRKLLDSGVRERDETRSLFEKFWLSVLLVGSTILKPVGYLSNLFVSPAKEFEADAFAASKVGTPLFSQLLRKLSAECVPMNQRYYFIHHLFFSHPRCEDAKREKLGKLFSTYPSIAERLRALEALEPARSEGGGSSAES